MDLPHTTTRLKLPSLSWDHWHIEPSSICSLKCPRCPRAEVSESLLSQQLDLDFFQRRIGTTVAKQIKKVTFCGNDGDPIYCRDLLEIISWLKTTNPQIQLVLITNGSYKPQHWWTSLGKLLSDQDEVQWSIDGWDQHSNEKYRINCNWNSIINGISAFNSANSHTYKTWATIAFRFNENYLDKIKCLATETGFDQFQLTKSTKFGSKYPDAYGRDDLLEPIDRDLISSGHRFERESINLTDKTRPGAELKQLFFRRAAELKHTNKYSNICYIGNKGVFLNSQGEFYPCCWTANRYPHNKNWLGRFNLYQKTFDEIINDCFWKTEFLKFDELECKTKCTQKKLEDLTHVVEW